MEMPLPRAVTPRHPGGRPASLSRRQLEGPTPVSRETAPIRTFAETTNEAHR